MALEHKTIRMDSELWEALALTFPGVPRSVLIRYLVENALIDARRLKEKLQEGEQSSQEQSSQEQSLQTDGE